MTIELRTVFDTGVAVSAVLLPRSIPRQAFDLAAQSGRLLASEATVEELVEVLRRPKFDKYVSQWARLEFLITIVGQAEIVPITHQIVECRDSKDNKFLELAVSGQASHIISGDTDLLVLNPFRDIGIMSPEEFLSSFKVKEWQTLQMTREAGTAGKTMKKAAKSKADREILDEYDFSKGVRGKYAKRYAEGTNVVVLSPDVAAFFPDSDAVNKALRGLVELAHKSAKKAAAN